MRHTFFCIDGHTAGNPVRLIAGGIPLLRGATMGERRLDFLERFDWIRTGLCFEPRGHSIMSGGFLFPPTREDSDGGILFIETSGCLPMCGHGTIGLVTFGLEHGLLTPRVPGNLRLEVPAGMIDIEYVEKRGRVTSVRIRNVPSYVAATGIDIDVAGLGALRVDVAYGGNYYAIVEPQGEYKGLDALGAARILELSPLVREEVRAKFQPVHPVDPAINGVSHVLWADAGVTREAGRNAVFYGDHAIDRSPCGTGTSARLAHLHAKGLLAVGDRFVHESYIHSRFVGRVESEISLPSPTGSIRAITPLIEGSAVSTGFNTIWIDPEDVFCHGFEVT